MDTILEIKSIESGYGEVQVLWGISLQVKPGKLTTIIGANGAGKTTTLRSVMGSVRTWKGKVVLNGEDITKLPPHARANRGLVLVPEGRQLSPICRWKRTWKWELIPGAPARDKSRTWNACMTPFLS